MELLPSGKPMTLLAIRHASTELTARRAYCGSSDPPLSQEGESEAARSAAILWAQMPRAAKGVGRVYVPPKARCLRTAQIFFPAAKILREPGLAEMDFGLFEGRTAEELLADKELAPLYQKWVDSGCEGRCPQGESKFEFRNRILRRFSDIIIEEKSAGRDALCVVAHAGTFMAVLEEFAAEERAYFDWKFAPAEFRLVELKA